MAEPLKLLFLTHSEYGQANAVLSVAHELCIREDTEVHIGSFSDLKPRIAEVNDTGKRVSSKASMITFHTLEGRSMAEIFKPWEKFQDMLCHEAGFPALWKSYKHIPLVFMCWSGEEYMSAVRSAQKVIEDLKPDLVIIDGNFFIGTDAARSLGVDFMFISPNSFKDITGPLQPNGASIWKIPPFENANQAGRFGSGWMFPMSLWQIPLNVILQIRLAVSVLTHPSSKSVFKARTDAGIEGPFPMFDIVPVPFVCPCRPEMDFPVFVPDNYHGCGPFLLPSEPVEKLDPELAEWIQRGPLVLINRGSHVMFSDPEARRMAEGIRILRNRRPEVRILWKLKPGKGFNDTTLAVLQPDRDSDMIRTVNWLKPEPVAIMRTGKVICYVNHGGANSWFEAASVGVPQVILPAWFDCYDWAIRSEYLGVGVWGTRKGGLALDGTELGEVLLRACEEPSSEQHLADVDEAPDSQPLLPSSADTNEVGQNSNLRVNAQRLAAKAGKPGARKAAEIIAHHAAECRRKKAEQAPQSNSGS